VVVCHRPHPVVVCPLLLIQPHQVVVDWDQNPQFIVFSNLQGKSYSNSFQAQIDYELMRKFDVRLAYRLFDVKTDYSTGLLQKPLVSRHRAFVNLAYETKGKWKFEETDHFYVFSNVDEKTHFLFSNYNERLYDKLCEVLDHKDGDPLWNNKCHIYYFKTHRQFQVFAGAIDGSPGAGMSGGCRMRMIHASSASA